MTTQNARHVMCRGCFGHLIENEAHAFLHRVFKLFDRGSAIFFALQQAIAHWVGHPTKEDGAALGLHHLRVWPFTEDCAVYVEGTKNIERGSFDRHRGQVMVPDEQQHWHFVCQPLDTACKLTLLGFIRVTGFESIASKHG